MAPLCDAIRRRRYLGCWYHGGMRVVMPLIHGVAGNGSELLSAVQVTGFSASGATHGWKNMLVGEMSRLVVLPRGFVRLPDDYNPDDPTFARIHCRVLPSWVVRR